MHQRMRISLLDCQLILFNDVHDPLLAKDASILMISDLSFEGATNVEALGNQLFFWSLTCFYSFDASILQCVIVGMLDY